MISRQIYCNLNIEEKKLETDLILIGIILMLFIKYRRIKHIIKILKLSGPDVIPQILFSGHVCHAPLKH